MHTSRLVILVAAGAIALPLSACGTSTVAPSSRTTTPIGKQMAELEGTDTVAGDGTGSSVAISGTTAIVGAYDHAKDAGRAYLFSISGSSWHQVTELQGADTVAGDEFGSSVAISGTTAVVGAGNHADHAGSAYVFTKTPDGWKQAAELKGSDTTAGDYFGWSVAVSGTTAVVGAYGHAQSAGRVYVFTKTPGGWKQAAELKGDDSLAGDQFGSSVAISGRDRAGGCNKPRGGLRRGLRVHKDVRWLEAGRRAEGLRHRLGQSLRLVGRDLGHNRRGGRISPRQQCRASVRIRRNGKRLEAGRRVGGLRHRGRRRLRHLGGHDRHGLNCGCNRSRGQCRAGVRVHQRRQVAGSRPPSWWARTPRPATSSASRWESLGPPP